MGLSDIVSVAVVISLSQTVTTQTFSVPLVVSYHTHWPQRSKLYSTQGIGAALVADGYSVNEPGYKAALTIAAQSPAPGQILMGRRANKPQQTVTLTIADAVQNDVIGFTLVGSDGVSHAIAYTIGASATTTTVAAAVTTLINAITGASTTIGTVTSAAAVITIARTDGLLTDVQGWQTQSTLTTAVTLANTTADPGIVADLTAIYASNVGGWYGLVLDSNSKAEIVAAQSWVEATGQGGKVAFYDNADSANVTAVTTDVFSVLQTSAYQKCFVQHSGQQLLNWLGAAAAGELLAMNPGSYTAAFKTWAGPPADTEQTLPEAGAMILNTASTSTPGNGGKNGNYYKVFAGQNKTNPGACPNGQYFDLVVFLDWLQVNTQADVANIFFGLPKVPYTDHGIGLIKDAIDTRLRIGASASFGGIDGTRPIVVNVPAASSVTPTSRAKRDLPGVLATAFLSGAIQTTEIAISVSP